MGALEDIQLLEQVTGFLLPKIEAAESVALNNLNSGASTTDVNAVRSFRLQKSIILVGMFSLLEAVLKDKYGLGENAKPFGMMEERLKANGKNETARMFKFFWSLNDVLKHGEGRSWNRLNALRKEFPAEFGFLKHPEEGDIAIGHELVVIDSELVIRCAKVIQEASHVELDRKDE